MTEATAITHSQTDLRVMLTTLVEHTEDEIYFDIR